MVITVVESSSSVTSTSFKIKDLLLRAWRERWSEIEWGRNIKRLLRGVSGDIYDLADCILRQAINGPVTNQLLMLYLNHCLDSQIVSFGSCIMAITKIHDLKPQCINSLLDFLIRYRSRTNCYGNDDECLALCRSLVSFIYWLYTVIENSLAQLNENSSVNDYQNILPQNASNQPVLSNSMFNGDNIHVQIMQKAVKMLRYIGDCSYLKALLYIGKLEEKSLWKQWLRLHRELISKLFTISNNSSGVAVDKCSVEPFIDALQTFQNAIQWLGTNDMDKYQVNGQTCPKMPATATSMAFHIMTSQPQYSYIVYRPLSFHSIRLLVSFYAILDPSCSNEVLANFLIIIGRTFDLSLPQLYCETLHTCLVGLIDTHYLTNEDRKIINYHAWIAFFLFKIPRIFLHLSQHGTSLRKESTQTESNQAAEGQYSVMMTTKNDLEIGLDLLLEFGPCIDQFLLRYKTEHWQKLLDCFKEPQINLISSGAVERFMKEMNRRMLSTCELAAPYSSSLSTSEEQEQGSSSTNCTDQILIIRAFSTVKSILTSLSMDSCNIENLAGIICRMQNSFDIILCAAATNGMLPQFAQHLMELNRSNMISRGENVKSSQIRAVVFDITFISLCSLVERYGSEVIESGAVGLNESLGANSFFFSTWCRWNLPSSNACYSPDIILSSYKDTSKYDHLLPQLVVANSTVEFKTSLVSWDEMCVAAQFAAAEVLNAWIQDVINRDMVKIFLERLKSRLCFLALSAACWLFAKLSTVTPEHQAKVMFMLNELLVPPLQMEASTETFSNDPNESNLSFKYKQRFLLMSTTFQRLFARYVPHSKLSNSANSSKALTSLPIRLSKSPMNVLLKQCLDMTRNNFTSKLIHDIDGLIALGGPQWFVTQIVKYLFSFNDVASLQDSVDLAFGLFHLDLEQCALAMIKQVLPKFLLSKSAQFNLIEPKISALIRLTVITAYSAIEQLIKFRQLNLPKRYGHRRKYQEVHDLSSYVSIQLNDSVLDHTPFYYKCRDFNQLLSNSINDGRIRSNQRDDHQMEVDGDHQEIADLDDKWIYSDSDLEEHQWILKEPLYIELINLFQFILEQSFECEFSPWLLVPVTLLEQIVLNLREDACKLLRFVSFNLLEAIIQSPNCPSLSFEQLLAYLVLDSVRSRKIGAKLICQLQLSAEYVRHSGVQTLKRSKETSH